jgi:hypothetical protein
MLKLTKTELAPLPLLSIDGEAENRRNELAQSALAITTIATADQNAVARNIAVEIRTYLKDVEAARVFLTKPLRERQQDIKRLADDHTEPLNTELQRLERLATGFLIAEGVRVAAETKARLELTAEAQNQADFDTISNEPMPTVARAQGQTLRQVLKWEVTDLRALVQARPDLCKIEPKASAINATCIPEMPNLPPGLKLWWENASTFSTR